MDVRVLIVCKIVGGGSWGLGHNCLSGWAPSGAQSTVKQHAKPLKHKLSVSECRVLASFHQCTHTHIRVWLARGRGIVYFLLDPLMLDSHRQLKSRSEVFWWDLLASDCLAAPTPVQSHSQAVRLT